LPDLDCRALSRATKPYGFIQDVAPLEASDRVYASRGWAGTIEPPLGPKSFGETP